MDQGVSGSVVEKAAVETEESSSSRKINTDKERLARVLRYISNRMNTEDTVFQVDAQT